MSHQSVAIRGCGWTSTSIQTTKIATDHPCSPTDMTRTDTKMSTFVTTQDMHDDTTTPHTHFITGHLPRLNKVPPLRVSVQAVHKLWIIVWSVVRPIQSAIWIPWDFRSDPNTRQIVHVLEDSVSSTTHLPCAVPCEV